MFNETLCNYLTTMGHIPRLPKEKDATATKEELIKGNLRLVVHIASKGCLGGNDLLDRIQDGNIGLIIAAERYDPAKGPFGNYAGFHIRNCIAEGQVTMSRTVRLPRAVFKNFRKIEKLAAEGLPLEQIAEELGLPVTGIRAALSYEKVELTIESKCPDNTPEQNAERHILDKRIEERLTLKQRNVVTRTLQGQDAKDIAEDTGVSHQAVRQARNLAIARLREEQPPC